MTRFKAADVITAQVSTWMQAGPRRSGLLGITWALVLTVVGVMSFGQAMAARHYAPTLSLSANLAQVQSGQSSTLTWTSTNARTCSASGSWSGAKARSGAQTMTNITTSKTYTLTCTNRSGSVTKTAQVTVGAASAPTLSLSANPAQVQSGQSSTLTWTSTNATSCTASGDWSGTQPISGTSSTGALSANKTYVLACTGSGGGVTQTAQVSVAAAPAPTLSFSASPSQVQSGQSSTLTWTSTNATSCSASGSWTGVQALSGVQTITNITMGKTYSLGCTGQGGSIAKTVQISVLSPSPDPTPSSAFHVGPGQQYANIGDVPWYSLQPGSTVYIHYRSTPYREKFLISGQGTPSAWIRVLGVPDPTTGALPVISGNGATTSTTNHFRWQDLGANGIQWDGVVFIAARSDDASGGGSLPQYIEIANLQIQDGYKSYSFTGENGGTHAYEGFAACIYSRSAKHILIRNNVLTNCGQGFYNWTGDGSAGGNTWWDGVQADTVLRGNYFYNNGNANSYTEHQTYTESDGVTIEYNRFGPQRSGALGSQLKDRSAGTIIRYNFIEQSPDGWDLDLVEPQESYPAIGSKPTYKQAFVYGNIIVNNGVSYDPNLVHWNEDHMAGQGRATLSGGKLFFYDNTVVTVANQSDMGWDAASSKYALFNVTWGAYECPPGTLPGVIDVRNNIIVTMPRTPGSPVPHVEFGYCGKENFAFGNNWVSPGYVVHGAAVTGAANLISPSSNDPGFVSLGMNDFHLTAGSSALGIGASLAPEVTVNTLNLDLTPTLQYVYHQQVEPRSASGVGSVVGAFGNTTH